MSWLDPVRAALEQRETPAQIFFRDDDAGWGDDRLALLLRPFVEHGVPVDVAVIPAEVTPALARLLLSQPEQVRLHQHGYAHVNHEGVGRKYEFGPSRDLEAQRHDIARGRALLLQEFGERLDPVFTPPWNRCTATTAAALHDLGIPVLSRDHTAPPLYQPNLADVPVTVDWFGKHKGVRWGWGELARQLAGRIARETPVGVMLHHAVTDDDELSAVAELVSLISGHPGCVTTHLTALAA
ncbi:MAG TPA: hypothetical protein VFJ97_15125 [Dermatophilaceae bacterium]|nr:hypothetical protein [Dermatophilaceae bacterium]